MIIRGAEIIREIVKFRSNDYPVVSFYLNVNVGQQPVSAYKIAAKDLVKELKQVIRQNEKKLNHEQIKSLTEDMEQFLPMVDKTTLPIAARGYALFTCSGKKFRQEVFLPLPVNNLVKIGNNPFICPLINILERYKKYGLCMVNRSRMLTAELSVNDILALEEMSEAVPQKVRYGGWQGYSEARIQRHVEEHVFEYLKHAAAFTFEFFKNRQIDSLILCGPVEALGDFEQLLPEALRRKVVMRRPGEMFYNAKKELLALVKEVDQELRAAEEKSLVGKIVAGREKNGSAVMGLHDVLRVLGQGAMLTLAVGDTYVEKGYYCFTCHHLSTEPVSCPKCLQPLTAVDDLIDELEEVAFKQGVFIKHIHDRELTAKLQNIGATLRFKPPA